MIVFFEDTDTGKVLFRIEDASIIPDVGDSIVFNNIWYYVTKRIFYLSDNSCTIKVKIDL